MTISTLYFKDLMALKSHIKAHKKTLYVSSQTSTVIPFNALNTLLVGKENYLANLSTIPSKVELLDNNQLKVSGGANWQEVLEFCRSKGRDVMSWPTDETANVLAGLATSATGERSFAFGSLRNQVDKITYLDFNGEEKVLDSKKKLKDHPIFESVTKDLLTYQIGFLPYIKMKNGPFPRLDLETDLMIGMEGQLGVIIEAIINTIPLKESKFLIVPLPKWEMDFGPHLEIFENVQNFRGKIYSVEFFDSNSLSYLTNCPLEKNKDFLSLEVLDESFEEVLANLISKLNQTNPENIFEMSRKEFHEIRRNIPRSINEVNSRKGVLKKGTDAQVERSKFQKLLTIYREMAEKGVNYTLLGHFGDAHLHFNYLPEKEQVKDCEDYLKDFYGKIGALQGSPFAEHGIGILKKIFLKEYLNKDVFKVYKHLKENMDPFGQFFTEGFLNLYKEFP